jgi:hypothetical protein
VSLGVHLTPENAPWPNRLPGLAQFMPLYSDAYGFALEHGVGVTWREHERFWRDEMERWSRLCCLRAKGSLPDDLVCARVSIGVVGYCLATTTLIDQKGLTDHHIAHASSSRSNAERYMAHDRTPDRAYLEERKVNTRLVGSARDPVTALAEASFALHAGDDAWLSFDSPDVAWVTRAFLGRELWSWIVAKRVGTFDSDDDGWTLAGTFAVGPRRALAPGRPKMWPPYGTGGRSLDSRSEEYTPNGRGRARSAPFVPPAGSRLSVRIAADSSQGVVGARLTCDGVGVHDFVAPVSDWLLPQVVEMTPWAGRTCVLEVHDDSDKAWIAVSDVVLLVPGPLDPP